MLDFDNHSTWQKKRFLRVHCCAKLLSSRSWIMPFLLQCQRQKKFWLKTCRIFSLQLFSKRRNSSSNNPTFKKIFPEYSGLKIIDARAAKKLCRGLHRCDATKLVYLVNCIFCCFQGYKLYNHLKNPLMLTKFFVWNYTCLKTVLNCQKWGNKRGK